MSLKTELQLVSTENLKARLAKRDTIGTFERETIIRILNEWTPAVPTPVKQGGHKSSSHAKRVTTSL
jgi:hypothetical protein